jgi:hypothetical protein
MRYAGMAFLAGACLLYVAPCAAAEPQVDERATLNREGLALADAGKWAEALERFQRVVALRASAKGWFNLARAEEHVGRAASAERDYDKALTLARSASEADVAAAAEGALHELAPRVPHVRAHLSVPSRPLAAHAHAEVDGQPIALDASTAVDPGDHAVGVHADGVAEIVRHVHVAERDQVDLEFDLPGAPAEASRPVEPSRPPEPPAPDAATSGRAVGPPLAIAAAGVIFLASGVVLYVTGKSSYDSELKECTGSCPSQAIADQGNRGRTSMIAGDALLAGGGAVVAVGLTALVLRFTRAAPPVTASFWGTGAALRGTF